MRANRGRDTGPEILLRKALHARGLRYKLNDTGLPGSPDIVFPRFMTAIFVHGCYWHHHMGCKRASIPKKNGAFWAKKFADNQKRDLRNVDALRTKGWRVGVVWECALNLDVITRVEAFIRAPHPGFAEWPSVDELRSLERTRP